MRLTLGIQTVNKLTHHFTLNNIFLLGQFHVKVRVGIGTYKIFNK